MRSNIETGFEEVTSGSAWPFVPICVGLGITLAGAFPYFAMQYAPWMPVVVFVTIFALFMRRSARQGLLWFGMFLIGFLRLGDVYQGNETQPFDHRYYGSIEGQVVMIDQSNSSALRLTLDQVELDGRRVHGKVRISLHGAYHRAKILPGSVVQTTGYLGPPSGPAEPGGYDFRKRAWADGLAAVGYTRKPLIASTQSSGSLSLWLLNFRLGQSAKYRDILGDEIGGFAAAIFVGDRSEIDSDVVDAMRRSNLAHLLAISGMHMGTVCGILFFGFRRGLALSRHLSNGPWGLRLAVLLALGLTSIYWLFSGMSYSATRAYLMAILLFMALIFARRAISLRSVALVACGILIVDPLALGDVGFQMSFAATTALIAFFSRVSIGRIPLPKWMKWAVGLAVTSLIAGLATAPFAAYHFNTVPKYGLLANMLAVSVMSFVVMPAGILTMFLTPLGLEEWPLWIVGKGIAWIIWVSEWVSSFDNPVWTVRATSPYVLLIVIAASFLYIFGRFRSAVIASVCIIIALFLWPKTPRPQLLVADDARFFGLLQGDKRYVSRATGHSFVAEIWAKRDGQSFEQSAQSIQSSGDPMVVNLSQGWRLVFTTTKKGAQKIEGYCTHKTIIIAAQGIKPKGDCLFYDEKIISEYGGMAIDIIDRQAIVTSNIDLSRVPWRNRK